MKEKNSMVIILPEKLADIPIQIVRSSGNEHLVFSMQSAEEGIAYADSYEKKYVFIWRQNDYLKITLDEILWVEAEKSYSRIYLSENRIMVISFNLAVVENKLPATDFMRIHRSCVVNLKHVVSLMGNSLKIENKLLTIGREYRDELLDRFIFLGIRRGKPK